ncbi:hypothetical protein, partial [Acinetobacter baumannii]|uniref:hypothetical protein n=1 Tax=Acinetobacter baumannii TaxID=470 RepID=UPI001BB46EAC
MSIPEGDGRRGFLIDVQKLLLYARYYISLPEFNEFKSRHIVLSKAARDMGKLPAHLANSLRARGLLTEIE